jgi:uncharacterized protein YodC (DUF2158 family)
MAKKFKAGDKVRATFGGTEMTVIEEKKGKIVCQWFRNTDEFQEASFLPQMLENVEDSTGELKTV